MSCRCLFALYALALCVASGCGQQIGDPCGTNVDCAIDGTRFCDIAPTGGYCTVEGCDQDSCPGDSVCVRFYTTILTEPCTYDPYDAVGSCAPDERCLCDDSEINGGGSCSGEAGNNAHCAPENSERRWCMRRCDSVGVPGGCRDGYECRQTGTLGAETVPSLETLQDGGSSSGAPQTFCVSTGQSM